MSDGAIDLSPLEHAPALVARYDRALRHVWVNRAAEIAIGRPRAELLGRTHAELGLDPEVAARWQTALERAVATGESGELEFTLAERIYQARISAERNGNGQVQTVLCVAHDVTDARALRLLEAAIQRVPAGVAMVEAPSGRIVFRNQPATTIF